jgi:hypothetical protein
MAEFADLAEKRAQTTHIPVVRRPALPPPEASRHKGTNHQGCDPIGLHFGWQWVAADAMRKGMIRTGPGSGSACMLHGPAQESIRSAARVVSRQSKSARAHERSSSANRNSLSHEYSLRGNKTEKPLQL